MGNGVPARNEHQTVSKQIPGGPGTMDDHRKSGRAASSESRDNKDDQDEDDDDDEDDDNADDVEDEADSERGDCHS